MATAFLDRGDVGVHIRRCADDPFSLRLGSSESRGLAPLAQDDDALAIPVAAIVMWSCSSTTTRLRCPKHRTYER